jgi:hypothetical protein
MSCVFCVVQNDVASRAMCLSVFLYLKVNGVSFMGTRVLRKLLPMQPMFVCSIQKLVFSYVMRYRSV